MNHNTPLSPCPLRHLVRRTATRAVRRAVARRTACPPRALTEQCRPGGPWQQLLPGVYLLHPGPPTSEERLHAALLYAGGGARVPAAGRRGAAPTGVRRGHDHRPGRARPARLLSRAAADLARPDRRAGAAHPAAAVRPVRPRRADAPTLPRPEQITGLPVAPVARALADAVAGLADADAVRPLLTEAVRGGHCEPAAVVRELSRRPGCWTGPHVVDAVDSLLAEGRALAEDRLYEMVRTYDLPDPLWNVDLRLPGGPHLGGVDAYWPDQAVAVELDSRRPCTARSTATGARRARRRVVRVRPQARAPGAARDHRRPRHAEEAARSRRSSRRPWSVPR